MKDLAFVQTWSVDEFKKNNHVDKLTIKKNESTGKYFFEYGFQTGACSSKVETGELTMPVISQVCVADTGEMFMLLHQKGNNSGATTLATL